MRRQMKGKKVFDGYFTVEAALVMPIVFMCYACVVLLLFYMYEKCIWEQNGNRLPVWMEYVEGYVNKDADTAEQFSGEEVCQYVLRRLEGEEMTKYFLGKDISAGIYIRGDYAEVNRSITYPLFDDKIYELTEKTVCFNPTEYIRAMTRLKNQVTVEKGEENDEK